MVQQAGKAALSISLGAAVLAGALHGATTAFAQDASTEVATERSIWRSVTIKANGFIDGIVFHPTRGGPAYIHTDMGGAYRLDGDQWVCLTDWITHDDWSLNQMGVETLAVDPTDANRVYAGVGTYMGPSAVIRSNDQGRTWERTNVPFGMNGNGSARQAGERMNVDPNQPSRLVYGTRDKGLWSSDDHGATWSQVESFPTIGDTEGPTNDTGIVFTLFDKSSGEQDQPTPVVYAGVMTTQPEKLFRSTDGGETWSAVPGQPERELLPNRAVLTPDGQTLYVTYIVADGYPGPHGVAGGSVYKVEDPTSDSPTWTEIAPAQGNFGWSGIAMDPTDPQTLYVTTLCRYADPGDDIYRTTDGGESWMPLHINDHRDDSSAAYALSMGMHWTGDVQVNPHDRNVAMFTTGWGIYRTTNLTDETPTWAFFNEGFEQSAVLELVSPREGSAHLLSAIGDRDGYRHEDFSISPVHGLFGQPNDVGQTERLSMGTNPDIDIAYDSPHLVVRVGGPAQFSDDGGLTWARFDMPPRPQQAEQPQQGRSGGGVGGGTIALSSDGDRVVWAPRGAAVHFASREGEGGDWTTWQPSADGPAGNVFLVSDPNDADTFYARSGQGFHASTDGGATWSLQTDGLPEGARWVRAIPGHAGHLWMNAGDEGRGGLHRSTDGGRTWQRIAADVVTVAKQVGVGAPAPGSDYPAIFVGGTANDLRGFFRSDDQGQAWVRVNDDRHHYGNVTVINGDSRVHGRLYVGTNGRGILYAEPAKVAAGE